MAPRRRAPKKKASKAKPKAKATSPKAKAASPTAVTKPSVAFGSKTKALKPWHPSNLVRELIKHCKDRSISLPSKTLRKAEYVAKLDVFDAGSADVPIKPEEQPDGEKNDAGGQREKSDAGGKKAPSPPPESVAGPAAGTANSGNEDLTRCTVAQLKVRCANAGIVVDRKDKKADIIRKLQQQIEQQERRNRISPTTSIGPEFRRQAIPPDPTRPIHPPREVLIAARAETFTGERGLGFHNPAQLCYRNALVIMLLHSSRLISWVKNRYIPNLEGAGFDLTGPKFRYRDVWTEFNELADFFWSDGVRTQQDMDNAMKNFWGYVTNAERQVETEFQSEGFALSISDDSNQQDVAELLDWLLILSINQLATFLENYGLNEDTREATVNQNIKELVNVFHSVRYPCLLNRRLIHRQESLQEALSLGVDIIAPADGSPATVETCIRNAMRFEFDRECFAEEHPAEEADEEDAQADEAPLAQRFAKQKIVSPPEVLFLHLKRFKFDMYGNATKDAKKVDIPEELDLTPFVETRGQPSDLPAAKYRLISIICHKGRNGKSGHYVANVRRNGQWTRFDDRTLSQTTLKELVDHRQAFIPYLILYEKIAEEGEGGVLAGDNDGHGPAAGGAQNDQDKDDDNAGNNGKAKQPAGRAVKASTTVPRETRSRAAKQAPASSSMRPNSTYSRDNPSSVQLAKAEIAIAGALAETNERTRSLFNTLYVQKSMRDVFDKMQTYYRQEAFDQMYNNTIPAWADYCEALEAALKEKDALLASSHSEIASLELTVDGLEQGLAEGFQPLVYYVQRDAQHQIMQREQAARIEKLEEANYIQSREVQELNRQRETAYADIDALRARLGETVTSIFGKGHMQSDADWQRWKRRFPKFMEDTEPNKRRRTCYNNWQNSSTEVHVGRSGNRESRSSLFGSTYVYDSRGNRVPADEENDGDNEYSPPGYHTKRYPYGMASDYEERQADKEIGGIADGAAGGEDANLDDGDTRMVTERYDNDEYDSVSTTSSDNHRPTDRYLDNGYPQIH